jgi:hypothetical protein
MLTLGPLSFAAPAALAALALLPVLWWLLRAIPPAPMRVAFPPIRFLADLVSREESAARTPLWLVLLRVILATALILGVARPLLDARPASDGVGPVVLVVDDGWAAAEGWAAHRRLLLDLIDDAERRRRSVLLLSTAPEAADEPARPPELLPAARARGSARSLVPKPWPTDRRGALATLERIAEAVPLEGASLLWLSDGLAEPGRDGSGDAFAAALLRFAPLTVYLPAAPELPLVLRPGAIGDGELRVLRARAGGEQAVHLDLFADDGGPLARVDATFAADAVDAAAKLSLPAEWANRLGRVEIAGQHHAGAILLADARWQRRPVGLAVDPAAGTDQPLLAGSFYLTRALEPIAEVRQGPIDELLRRPLTVLVLIDHGRLDPAVGAAVRDWVEAGGILLRFAGPRLAEADPADDPLLPVRLRAGDRTIGGALSWEQPGRLAPPDGESPFHGLEEGRADIEVRRQVLSEPFAEADARTWLRLIDGTPLVTARRSGDGWLVLVHTSANAEWSSLPLSGLFVEMLRRIVDLGRGVASTIDQPLAPVSTLDGFGRLGPPPATARPIAGDRIDDTPPGPRHPPGYYGACGERRAFDLASKLEAPRLLAGFPAEVAVGAYGGTAAADLRPWLLGLVLALTIVDLAASVFLRGLVRGPMVPARRPIGVAVLVLAAAIRPDGAAAQTMPAAGPAPKAALGLSLAYVETGDPGVDAVSRGGLTGLTLIVNRRTAAELDAPVGVDPDVDDLSFYPFLYWPTDQARAMPSPTAVRRLKTYLRGGGTIVFDSRVHGGGRGPAARELAQVLDLPPLVPAPADHLLRRAYYLLGDLPGRWAGETVWVERTPAVHNDGVSSVIAGSHDWAGAWAVDEVTLKPILPVVPGGERQREYAYRFGVNLVMHVLTGSYKADQVHLPVILERLGR